MSTFPPVGQPAPAFEGPTQSGEPVRLADFAGQPVALYFYPKDDTPGCTQQACNLRDNIGVLRAAGVAVVGVSGDTEKSHAKFAQKYELPFPLLADTDHAVATAYGVWQEKSFMGKKFMGVVRTTFLIGADGTLLHIFTKPKTGQHAEEILAKLEEVTA